MKSREVADHISSWLTDYPERSGMPGFVVGVSSVVFQTVLPIDLRPNRDVFVYGMVLLILLLRPSGLVKVKAIEEKV